MANGVLMTSAGFPKNFDRDIFKMWYNSYLKLEPEYTKIFNVQDAPPGKEYREAYMAGLGELEEITEGDQVTFDVPVEGGEAAVTYKAYGLGFQFTKKMEQDELFGSAMKSAKTLGERAKHKTELVAWDLINDVWTGTNHTAWDGYAIASASHVLTKTGATQSNLGSAAALSETTFQAMQLYFDQRKDIDGMPYPGTLKTLLVPTDLRVMANRLHNQMNAIGVAYPNDIMTANPKNKVYDTWDFIVCHYMTDTNGFVGLTGDADLRLFWKEKPKMETYGDFFTRNKLFRVDMRLGVKCFDWLGVYANEGA